MLRSARDPPPGRGLPAGCRLRWLQLPSTALLCLLGAALRAVQDVLRVLCAASEYDDLPVRRSFCPSPQILAFLAMFSTDLATHLCRSFWVGISAALRRPLWQQGAKREPRTRMQPLLHWGALMPVGILPEIPLVGSLQRFPDDPDILR